RRDHVAVAALERRAGHDAGRARVAMRFDPGSDRFEPGPAVVVGERLTAAHLLDVGRRVKAVGVAKRAIEPRRDQLADGRFAGARDANPHDRGHARNRLRHHALPAPPGSRGLPGSRWPPKPFRIAERIFSANVWLWRERNRVYSAAESTSAGTASSIAAIRV